MELIKTAIVLVGGKGTRLREAVPDLPKPLANIVAFPFLDLVLNYISNIGLEHVIFSVGYKADMIISKYGNRYENLSISYAHETSPLGTGGAIKNALKHTMDKDVLIMNGDTLFTLDFDNFVKDHHQSKSNLTVALKELENTERFGTALVKENYIVEFIDKGTKKKGSINGGVYIANTKWLEEITKDLNVFSFEKDILEKTEGRFSIRAYNSDAFFIDIGIAEDYNKLNRLVAPLVSKWTLFLDRDGTINKRLPNTYVKSWDEFQFLPGVLQSLEFLSNIFEKTIVVTNQQGIAKGEMTERDLDEIHQLMRKKISVSGGCIDHIYHCPELAANNPTCRKPSPGMAYQAAKEIEGVQLKNAIMVGDSTSDIEFAENAGMQAILLNPDFDEELQLLNCITYSSLLSLSKDLKELLKLVDKQPTKKKSI